MTSCFFQFNIFFSQIYYIVIYYITPLHYPFALLLCIIFLHYFCALLLLIDFHQLCFFHRVFSVDHSRCQIQWTAIKLFYYLISSQILRVSIDITINHLLFLIFFMQTNNSICKKQLMLLFVNIQFYILKSWHIFVEHFLLICSFNNDDNRFSLTKVSKTKHKRNSRILNESERMRLNLMLYESFLINWLQFQMSVRAFDVVLVIIYLNILHQRVISTQVRWKSIWSLMLVCSKSVSIFSSIWNLFFLALILSNAIE